ncbi:MAG: endonuclease/exonuclease/phosphatase family protein [bacterium]|nr:endonuclease/exonuclease/phosphatase family protein [bacterium]
MTEAAAPKKPRRLRPTTVAAQLCAVGFPSAIAGLLPSRHWLVDLPASFVVHGGATLLVGALVMLLARRWWLAGLFGTGIAAAATVVLPGQFFAGGGPSAPPNATAIEVLTMNLARGGEHNADRAIRQIERTAADIVFLSELTPAWLRRLDRHLDRYPFREVHADRGYFGVGLFSRLPIAAERIPLGFDFAPAIRARVHTPAGDIGLLGIHPPRPGRGKRCAQRDRALAAIPGAITDLPSRRIVFGDFNATPWNRAFRALLAETGLRHANGLGFAPTWPMSLPWPFRVPIDHVLVGGRIRVRETAVERSFGSDHAPLRARLALPD